MLLILESLLLHVSKIDLSCLSVMALNNNRINNNMIIIIIKN